MEPVSTVVCTTGPWVLDWTDLGLVVGLGTMVVLRVLDRVYRVGMVLTTSMYGGSPGF